ncbi:MAG: sugar ABC transporter permease [Oscillospiraceae bacterium]|nr:sugar ABC transporter permease [Oscillospiraceae bacterium]
MNKKEDAHTGRQKRRVQVLDLAKQQAAALPKKGLSRSARENLELYAIMFPTVVLIIIFMYVPLYGVLIAFQDYVPGAPFFGTGTAWVGLKHFKAFVSSYYFARIVKNTLVLNLMNLGMGFWVPIAFALLLNELKDTFFKKFVQTASYLPYFISSVVVAGMVLSFTATDGILNRLVMAVGGTAQAWNTKASAFPWIYTLTCVWQSFGWGSILYLSSISSIDPSLYEAADLDGAGRLKKIWYVTLPFMLPLIIIQLIFAIGGLMSIGTEMILLLYNPSTYSTADVIGTYVYREGLLGGKFSSGAASGLFMSAINLALTFGANAISRKFTDYSLW